MPKDFGHWISGLGAVTPPATPYTDESSPPNLLRSVTELEDDLYQRVMRNLHPADVPRGQDYYQEVLRILQCKQLPEKYALSPVWQHAHQLYWQIQAFKGSPDAVMWHPV